MVLLGSTSESKGCDEWGQPPPRHQLQNNNLCAATIVAHLSGESSQSTEVQTWRHSSLSNTATLNTKLVDLPHGDNRKWPWLDHRSPHETLFTGADWSLQQRSRQVVGDKEGWLQTHFIMTNVQDQIYKK